MREITRRSFGTLCLSPLANGLFGSGTGSEGAVFPFGAHVYREPHLPLDQLRSDMGLLKRLGFTMVKVQESWSADEAREGEIDLSTVERVISDARQHGLLVYFGVTMEQAPAWLWRKYPEANMVYETGEPHNAPTQYLMPSDGKPGPCWHHPGARAAATRFMETVGTTLGRYDNIAVWNVWQEIGYWPLRPGFTAFCYCKHTLAAYREWLRHRHGTLEKLNAVWRTHFADWEEVEPPRLYTQVPSWIDWRYFMEDVHLAETIRWKAESFRRSDPGKRPILAHVGRPTIGSTAEWRYAESLDLFGSSAYPSWGEIPEPGMTDAQRVRQSAAVYRQLWDRVLLSFDYVRGASATGEFWTAELQGGRAGGGVDPGRIPDRGDIRRWTLACLATGARGICFWNHRTEPFWGEAHGFGLLQMTGETSERAEEASRIAKAVARHAELFAKGQHPRGPVAILLNARLWHFLCGSGQEVRSRYEMTIRGIYKALWEDGIAPEFVETASVGQVAGRYKVLIFPYPILVSESDIGALRAYVRDGGTLIAEACAGRYDGDTFGVRGEMAPGLVELFGASNKELNVLPSGGPRALVGAGEFAGLEVTPTAYLQCFEPGTSTPILMFSNEVVGCMNNYGKGRGYLIGTLLGRPVAESDDSRNQKFIGAMLRHAGVRTEKIGKLQVRRRVLRDKQAWFLFNCTREVVEESIPLEGFRSVVDLFDAGLRVGEGSARVAVEPMDIRCLILDR